MKPISDVTCLVFDHGLFLPIAHRMAKECKRVLYHSPWEDGFPTVNRCIIGDGFNDIERCDDIFKVIDEVDLFVFPDLLHSGLQLHLESLGKKVWGSRNADSIELNRIKFHRILHEVGLPVPKFQVIHGLAELRKHLHNLTDKYIKVSRYRGTMETHHWRDKDSDEGWLDVMAVKLGPFQNHLPFLVVDPIECEVEVGGDTYCVDGKWPNLMLHGDEEKDKCYCAAVTKREDMPDVLKDIMEAFSPVLEKDRYRNLWSMETRDGRFIDPTTRGGLPSTGTQLTTWKNFPEIIWCGANGELIDPVPEHQFSVECILSLKSKKDEWGKIRIDEALMDNVQLAGACMIDGAICFPPDGHYNDDVGWLVAGGNSMQEAIDKIHELEDQLPDGLSAATEPLVGLLDKIQKGEKEGIEFSKQEVPNPEAALNV